MANVRTLQRSFAGGEMSPEMFGRIDDVKFQTGAAKLRNFIAKPQGPVENRSGFEFVREVQDSTKRTRLIPFTYSTTQTMMIECGEGYFRFHSQGGTLLVGSVSPYQSGSTVTMTISKTSTVTITIASPGVVSWGSHTLSNGDPVIFTTTGLLPTGIEANRTYYVVNQAAGTFQFSATVGGTAINTSGTQSGVHTATVPCVVTWNSHGLLANAKIGFTTTGALPTGITASKTYYVRNPTANNFELSATSGGNAVITSGTQSGVHTGTVSYQPGDLVSSGGVNYYCIKESINNAPPNATYWYVEPANGIYQIPNPYAEADLFDIHHVQSADVLTMVHPNYPPRELRRLGTTKWTLIEINFGATLDTPSGLTVTRYIPPSSTVNVDTYSDMTYVVTAIDDDLSNESSPSAPATVSNNIFVTGARNTISWTAVPGASRYYVYKLQGGIYGYIGNTTSTSIIDDNINPDLSRTPPVYENDFTSANNYPGAVSYFEQRRCFAGTLAEPQKIWMTKSGTESNMSYGIPISDDDRIEFRIAAREANTIRHIVPLTELLLMTGSAEWRVTSVNSDAITPNTISIRPQSYIGASNVQPVIINNSMVYAAARGGHIRELGYNWQANGFVTGDLSLRAAHLFDSKEIVDMAYTKAPQPLVWFVSTSGNLIGLTYVPEQQIGAWHWHDTDGVFESCAVVAEGDEDILYCIIRRNINGVQKRYVERMLPRSPNSYADDEIKQALINAFFVDSGLTYNGNNTSAVTMTITGGTTWGPADALTITASSAKFVYPGTSDIDDQIVFTDAAGEEYYCRIASTSSSTVATIQADKVLPEYLRNTATATWAFARNSISGLSHLEGKEVSILTDGAVHPRKTVTAGTVTLDTASVIVTIGLPYESDMQSLPLAMQIDNGMGQGRYKNINKAWLRVFRSSGIFIGPDENSLVEAKQRTTEVYGKPPDLKSQEIEIMLTPSWADSGQVYVRQIDPLPLTIVGMTLEVAIGG